MRVVGEIPHHQCKITIYSWNNRYIVKLEQGYLEQTFKVDQFDVSNDDTLLHIINETFIQEALTRFDAMHQSWNSAIQRA